MSAVLMVNTGSGQADHICRRVVDALLREDLRGCMSQGRVVEGMAVPFARHLPASLRDGAWLLVPQLGAGRLWLPVQSCSFMQDWRLRALPMVLERAGELEYLRELCAILAYFRQGLNTAQNADFDRFEEECAAAVAHGEFCAAEQARWFASGVHTPAGQDWAGRLLHYDRLGAFLDHPFYPTARAKLGFATDDLADYAPEFAPRFKLRWLAVPKDLYQGIDTPLPDIWPDFQQLGLNPLLAASHALIPVHPFLWAEHLAGFLAESGLQDKVTRAPEAYLEVQPTLSVRTLALAAASQWHVKLPLTIRTLGARNIRTIKPSTIADGQLLQDILGAIASRESSLNGRLLLTDESRGAHGAHKPFLGFILRRYPDGLEDSTLVSVASLLAPAPDGKNVFETLAERFYAGRALEFFADYLDLTLRLHLLLWVRYGMALESNQQNSVLVLSDTAPGLRLLIKDNDAGRIWADRLALACPDLAARLDDLQDRRIVVSDAVALAQMFSTITLQLNIAVLVEGLAAAGHASREDLYRQVRARIEDVLGELAAQGEAVDLARQVLLEDERLYIKYLLRAASLESKESTGAADVNKFYGKSAPNFLRNV